MFSGNTYASSFECMSRTGTLTFGRPRAFPKSTSSTPPSSGWGFADTKPARETQLCRTSRCPERLSFGVIFFEHAYQFQHPDRIIARQRKRRRHRHDSIHLQPGRHQQRQHAAHRKLDEKNMIRYPAQQMIAIFNRRHPIRVTRADHVFGLGRVTCESNPQASVSMLIQKLPQQTHLFGSAGESVNEQAGGFC